MYSIWVEARAKGEGQRSDDLVLREGGSCVAEPCKASNRSEREQEILKPDIPYDRIRLDRLNDLKYGLAEETRAQAESRKHLADLQRLRGFRPIDDDFMRCISCMSMVSIAEMIRLVD